MQIWNQLLTHVKDAGFHKVSDRDGDRLVYWWLDHWAWLILPIAAVIGDIVAVTVLVPRAAPYQVFAFMGLGIVNLVFLYAISRRLFNYTSVMLTSNEIIVRRGPIPWTREFRIYRDDVISTEIEEKTRRDGESGRLKDRYYNLLLNRRAGKPVWLIRDMSSFMAAGLAKDAVRDYLRLPTEPS